MKRSIPFLLILFSLAQVPAQEDRSWVEPMRQVHSRFKGSKGTFAHFGDSITVTLAFWSPLIYTRKNAPREIEDAFAAVKAYMKPECWFKWKGPEYGNQGSMTIRWAHSNIDAWLAKLNPEVALIMFGTNDLTQLELEEYGTKMREVVEKCLKNGTVVILSTIPPRSGLADKAKTFAECVRKIAREMKVPLVDYHAEIIKRRPDDWDGSMEKFKDWKDYNVPTLIARDGVHPSHPDKYKEDYSEEALSSCGYSLRNALVLLEYAKVIEALEKPAGAPTGRLRRSTAPVLPPSRGRPMPAQNVQELYQALAQALPGDCILLADGQYRLPQRLEIRKNGLTIRSASGYRDGVVLDGKDSRLGELVAVTGASGVMIADLTIQNAQFNGFKIDSETGVHRLTIRNCVIHNIWQRGVKGVKVPPENREQVRPQKCRIEYCLFYNDRPKEFADDPTDTAQTFGGDYIGGIDVMYAKGWTISDNIFVGIQGRTRQGRGAVFLWHESEDCVVERNIIVDCDSGICLGNSFLPEGTKVHAVKCTVRNNFVTRCPESGILADHTEGCAILHNTIQDPSSRLGRLIRLVHSNAGLTVANNLLSGPKIRNESESPINFQSNLEGDFTGAFTDPASGDLHLKDPPAEILDKGVTLPQVPEDFDREPRREKPDIGADEVSTSR